MFPANTFLIGAQKSGTTFLAALLDHSPQVCVSDPKEPHYLTHNHSRGEAFYRDCFSDPSAPVRLDASTTYTVLRPRAQMEVPDAPGILDPVPDRIRAAVPDARLIYIMRDPVKRAVSAWRHNARSKPAVQAPQSLIAAMQEDPMLLLTGRYADQIERYLEVFAPEQFLFLDFRELTRDPLTVLARTCGFLGIEPPQVDPDAIGEKRNSNYQMTGAGHLFETYKKKIPGLQRNLRRLLPDQAQRVLIDRVLRRPSEVSFYDEAEAAALFEDDRARVRTLTGLEI